VDVHICHTALHRMAVATNAIILPFSAIGAAESFDILLDSNEQLSIPVLGTILKRQSDAIPGKQSQPRKLFIST
jgi:hypothetical protein